MAQSYVWCGIKPVHDTLKINTNGNSFKNLRRAGFGSLVRDEDDILVIGFSGHVGISTNMHAELKAIRQGLLIVMELDDMKFELESDSYENVNLIKARDTFTHEFKTMIPSIAIRHVLREANSCADTLAKMGAHGTTRLSLWKAPFLSYLLCY